MLPVECIVRGYLAGSGWQEYRATGRVCGVTLPSGLREADRLPEPLFAPSTKAPSGEHDENISFEHAVAEVGDELADAARDLALAVYRRAAAHAEERGIVLADTKFELGPARRPARPRRRGADAGLVALLACRRLGARHDPAELRQAAGAGRAGGHRLGPAARRHPRCRRGPWRATRARYVEAYERLSGRSFADWPGPRAEPQTA